MEYLSQYQINLLGLSKDSYEFDYQITEELLHGGCSSFFYEKPYKNN